MVLLHIYIICGCKNLDVEVRGTGTLYAKNSNNQQWQESQVQLSSPCGSNDFPRGWIIWTSISLTRGEIEPAVPEPYQGSLDPIGHPSDHRPFLHMIKNHDSNVKNWFLVQIVADERGKLMFFLEGGHIVK